MTTAAAPASPYATREKQEPPRPTGEEQNTRSVAAWLRTDYERWYRQVRELRRVYRKRAQYEVFNPGQMDLPRGVAVLKVVIK